MQKRPMNFTPGLENENSFMIIPNEFVKDHPLTQEEITSFMTPDADYERELTAKYGSLFMPKPGLLSRIKMCIKSLVKSCAGNDPDKILRLKMRWNHLCRRRLPSKW